MKTYKYRHREIYKDVPIDIKADTLSSLTDKLQKRKIQIDKQFLDPTTKLKGFAERYLETYKANVVSSSWYDDIQRITYNKIVPGIGDKPVGRIKPIDIQMFLNSLTGYADSHIKKIYDLTCQLFRYAYKNGLTSYDFTLDLERPKGIKGKTGRSITKNERKVLLRVLNGHRGELFCKIMLYCGLRPGEVCALLWKDIDLESGIIDVNKAQKKDGTIGEPKSKDGIRKVPIPSHLIEELKTKKGLPFSLVCPQINGSPHTESSRKKMWNNIRRLMNIEMGAKVFRNKLIPPLPLADDFTMYNLRHTYCTDLEKAGVPINIARQLMGHSDISITSKIYTHASTESMDIARGLINSMGNTMGNNAENY